MIPSDYTPTSINRLADRFDLNRLAYRSVVREFESLRALLDADGIPYSSNHIGWQKWWEYASAVIESGVWTGARVLDAGGTATPLSFYLARQGCEVHTVDLNRSKLEWAEIIRLRHSLAQHNSLQDISRLAYRDEVFDFVFCICVIEHIPPLGQRRAMAELARVLKPGGILAITFDYGASSADWPILQPSQVHPRLIVPSGLTVLGNREFVASPKDWGNSSPSYTFGSLFLAKPTAGDAVQAIGPTRFTPTHVAPTKVRCGAGSESAQEAAQAG